MPWNGWEPGHLGHREASRRANTHPGRTSPGSDPPLWSPGHSHRKRGWQWGSLSTRSDVSVASQEEAVTSPCTLNEMSKCDSHSGNQTLSPKYGQTRSDGYPGLGSELCVIPGCPNSRGGSIRPQLLSATEQGSAALEGEGKARERPSGLECPHPGSAATGTLPGTSDCSLALLTLFHTLCVYKWKEGQCG